MIGYSITPLIVTVFTLMLLGPIGMDNFFVTFLLNGAGVLWASRSSGAVLVAPALRRRRMLVLYPIVLLNVYFISLSSGV